MAATAFKSSSAPLRAVEARDDSAGAKAAADPARQARRASFMVAKKFETVETKVQVKARRFVNVAVRVSSHALNRKIATPTGLQFTNACPNDN